MSNEPTLNFPEFSPSDAYTPVLPRDPQPIVILGAGGIVRDAHLPAYRKAGFPVVGIANRTATRAQALAEEFGIERVFTSVSEAVDWAPRNAIFDLALMPEQYLETLSALPDGAGVLIQKPLGQNLVAGKKIRDICNKKHLVAAVNTQLRFAPYVTEARRMIAAQTIGEIIDLEIRVSVETPWHMFPNVLGLDRLEINMHSVHYIDLVRSFLGDPTGVGAVTRSHPSKDIANTRSTIIMYYGDRPIRVAISANHDHDYGPRREESFIKWEGTKGAIRAQMGLLLDYPMGGQDSLEYILASEKSRGWRPIPFEGSWFPEAFIGSMGALQRFIEGSVAELPTSVDRVLGTMAVVDAAYESDLQGGVKPNL